MMQLAAHAKTRRRRTSRKSTKLSRAAKACGGKGLSRKQFGSCVRAKMRK